MEERTYEADPVKVEYPWERVASLERQYEELERRYESLLEEHKKSVNKRDIV